MSTRAERYDAVVTDRRNLSPHLLRLTLSAPGLESTGIADESVWGPEYEFYVFERVAIENGVHVASY